MDASDLIGRECGMSEDGDSTAEMPPSGTDRYIRKAQFAPRRSGGRAVLCLYPVSDRIPAR